MASCARDRDRLANLLCRLRECATLEDVPLELLAEPQPDTRPSVKLVAHYHGCRQVFKRHWQVEKTFERMPIVVALLIFMGVSLSIDDWTIVLEGLHDAVWWSWIVFLFGTPLFMLVVLLVLFFAANSLLVQTQRAKGDLYLDFNELRAAAPGGFRLVRWRDVYTATPRGNHRVRVELENGDILDVWLPMPGDRDALAGLMRELIRLHHRELHGLSGPETQASGSA